MSSTVIRQVISFVSVASWYKMKILLRQIDPRTVAMLADRRKSVRNGRVSQSGASKKAPIRGLNRWDLDGENRATVARGFPGDTGLLG